MIKELTDKLLSSCGNGKTKIIYGPKKAGKHSFLFNVFSKCLLDNSFTVIDTRGKRINDLDELLQDNYSGLTFGSAHRILLVDDSLFYECPEKIIDLGANSGSIDVFVISDKNIEYSLVDKMTLLRGRYELFYFPYPMFENLDHLSTGGIYYGSDLFSFDLIDKKLLPLTKAILSFKGKPCSLRDIQSKLPKDTSLALPSIAKYINMLCEDCFFTAVERIDVKNGMPLTGKKCYIPSTLSMYEHEKIVKMDYEDLAGILTTNRLLFDGWNLFSGVYHYQPTFLNKRRYAVNNETIVLRKNDQWFILFFRESVYSDYPHFYTNVKTFMQKILITYDSFKNYYHDHGIIVYPIMPLLIGGLKLNGI